MKVLGGDNFGTINVIVNTPLPLLKFAVALEVIRPNTAEHVSKVNK